MAAGLKEVRERIKSVNSTQQITKAMKMVSAAKLRRAQQAITQMRPYADKQSAMLSNILSNLDGDGATSFGEQREVQHATVVVVTSNRGLCGAFNTNIIKAAVALINEKFDKQRKAGKLTIVCVGKKAFDFFRRRYTDCTIVADYVTILAEDNSFYNVAKIPQRLMNEFKAKQTDSVYVCYGRFKNAATQFAEAVPFLPVAKAEKSAAAAASKKRADYSFEPDKTTLLEQLVPSILQTTFYKCTLDTTASEHGARMTAMDKATENANDLIKGLRITYNKARQESITKELSEIVGGVAALEG